MKCRNLTNRLWCFAVAVVFCGNLDADTKITPDVVYGHKAGMALTYDVLVPENPNRAAIIYMMSGGWFSAWQAPSEQIGGFTPLLREGFTIFIVRHGSAPRFKVPEAVSDVRAAVRHIKKHAMAFNIDIERIGVLGGSAGGHLSLMVGLNPEGTPMTESYSEFKRLKPKYKAQGADDATVAAIVAYFPPTDIRPLVGVRDRFPALNFPPEQAAAISPILFVTSDDPPTKLIHGDTDRLVPIGNSENLQRELDKAGVKNEFRVIKGGGHGFRRPEHRDAATIEMVAWFNQFLAFD